MRVWHDSTGTETPAAYWVYQAFYWGIFAGSGLAINVIVGGNIRNHIVSHVLFFLYSVVLTHIFRGQIQRRRLRQPSGIRMRMWLFAGILAISLIQTFLVISIDAALNGSRAQAWSRLNVVGIGWGM